MDQPISLDLVIGFLMSAPLFSELDPAERAEVVRIMEVQRYTDGERVFEEGTSGDAWYVVYEGKARVQRTSASGPYVIATLESGACFGEMALLDGQARSASVFAQGPLTVFRFRRARFEQLLDQGSLGAFKLVASMARTLSERHRKLTHEYAASGLATGQVAQYQISE